MSDRGTEEWKEFGVWLRDLRERRGLGRMEAAKESRVSVSTWAQLEAGGRTDKGKWVLPQPSARILSRIAQALGLPPAALLGAPDTFEAPAVRAVQPVLQEQDEELAAWLRRMDQRLAAIERAVGVTDEEPDREGEAG